MNGVRRQTTVTVPADWTPALVLQYATERIGLAENRRNRRVLHAELLGHVPSDDHPGHQQWQVTYLSAPATPPA